MLAFSYLCTRIWEQTLPGCHTFVCFGEMVEWSITPVLKTGVPRGTGGSNPSLSAEKDNQTVVLFFEEFSPPRGFLRSSRCSGGKAGTNHLSLRR